MCRFKNESFNGKTFKSNFKFTNGSITARTNGKLIAANASQLPASNRAQKIFYGDTILGEPNVVVTTDIFAYDDMQFKCTLVDLISRLFEFDRPSISL